MLVVSWVFCTLVLALVYYIPLTGIQFSWQMELCLASWTFIPSLSMMVLWQFCLTVQRTHFWEILVIFKKYSLSIATWVLWAVPLYIVLSFGIWKQCLFLRKTTHFWYEMILCFLNLLFTCSQLKLSVLHSV